MNFKTIATITAVVAFALGVAYMFAGALLLGRWQIEPTESVLLLGRRMGCLYLGLSVIFLLARSTPESVARTALSTGAAATLSLLALLGVYELIAVHAGAGILGSVAIEAILAFGYIRILFAERRATVEKERTY